MKVGTAERSPRIVCTDWSVDGLRIVLGEKICEIRDAFN